MKRTRIAILLTLIIILSLPVTAENARRPEKSSRSADDYAMQPTAIERRIEDYRAEQNALRDDLAGRLAEHEEPTPEQVEEIHQQYLQENADRIEQQETLKEELQRDLQTVDRERLPKREASTEKADRKQERRERKEARGQVRAAIKAKRQALREAVDRARTDDEKEKLRRDFQEERAQLVDQLK